MNRFEAVRKFARRIVDRFDLMPPIDVSNIFSEMDIQIVEEENQYSMDYYCNFLGRHHWLLHRNSWICRTRI